MTRIRKSAIALVASGALALGTLGGFAAPAQADGPEKEREFRVASAEVDFSVEKDDGRFEVDVDDAKRGTKWKVVLRHNGKKVVKGKWRADRDGDVVDFDRKRKNTKGKDRFKLIVKQVGKKHKKSRVITMR